MKPISKLLLASILIICKLGSSLTATSNCVGRKPECTVDEWVVFCKQLEQEKGWHEKCLTLKRIWLQSDSRKKNIPFYAMKTTKSKMHNPFSLLFSRTGAFMYVGNLDNSTIYTLKSDNIKTSMELKKRISLKHYGCDVYDMTQTPDGKNIYAVGLNTDSIASLSVNQETGQLKYIESFKSKQELNGPRSITVSKDGRFVYVIAWETVVIFSRDLNNGKLKYLKKINSVVLNGALDLIISPDNRYLYAATWNTSSIVTYSINQQTGDLSSKQVFKHESILKISEINISPDGVYLFASFRKGLGLFIRNPKTGLLTLLSTIDSFPDKKIDFAQSIAYEPDKKLIFLASGLELSPSIAWFKVDTKMGKFKYIDRAIGNNNIISWPNDLKITPDKQHVCLVSSADLGLFCIDTPVEK